MTYTQPSREPRQLEPKGGAGASTLAIADALQVSSLAGLLNVLKRRWVVIVFTMLVVCAATVAVLWQITPRYTAEAMVMLDTRKPQIMIGLQQQALPMPEEGAISVILKTETEVLRSPALALKVIDKVGLLNDPEFNPTLKPSLVIRLRENFFRSCRR